MDQTLMLAARRHEVEALNGLARGARVAAGELDDAGALQVGERFFATGDRVLALRNTQVDRADGAGRVALRNGNAGTVVRVDPLFGELSVRFDSGVEVMLPARYLEDGHLVHGYARTIHKSQGSTARRTFVLGSPDLAREVGYVAASRHTDETRFYVNVGEGEDLEQAPLLGVEDNPLYEELERRLGREQAKALALDETEVDAELGKLETAELLEITERGRTALTTIPRHASRAKDLLLLERAAAGVEANERRLENAREQLAGANGASSNNKCRASRTRSSAAARSSPNTQTERQPRTSTGGLSNTRCSWSRRPPRGASSPSGAPTRTGAHAAAPSSTQTPRSKRYSASVPRDHTPGRPGSAQPSRRRPTASNTATPRPPTSQTSCQSARPPTGTRRTSSPRTFTSPSARNYSVAWTSRTTGPTSVPEEAWRPLTARCPTRRTP